MEIVTPRKYSALATEKIAGELKSFKGDRYGDAVKSFVAATLTNFCEQNERFAQVVYDTPASLSDCCARIMHKCGNHISDIDVYRSAVQYYFPNAEVVFTMTIDASGEAPTYEQLKKPEPKRKTEVTESIDDEDDEQPCEQPKEAGSTAKQAVTPVNKKPGKQVKTAPVKEAAPKPAKQSKKNDTQSDDLIQLTLF